MNNISYPTFSLSLPIGLADGNGVLHQEGVMRPATGQDELNLQLLTDDSAYRVLVMLSQVILRLGNLSPLSPELLEGLFLLDLNYLQDCYNQINPPEATLSLLGE